jgi:hypothetical protein
MRRNGEPRPKRALDLNAPVSMRDQW